MLIRGVMRHEIKNHFHAAFMNGFNQFEKILHRAEHGVNICIVCNIVPDMHHRRRINRIEPDRRNSEFLQIGQSRLNTFQIANTVAIAILKTARIYLINHSGFPPAIASGIHFHYVRLHPAHSIA